MNTALKHRPCKPMLLPAQKRHGSPADRNRGHRHKQGTNAADHPIARQVNTVQGSCVFIAGRSLKKDQPHRQKKQNQQPDPHGDASVDTQCPDTVRKGSRDPHPVRKPLIHRSPPASSVDQQQKNHHKNLRQRHPDGNAHASVHGRKILLYQKMTDFIAIAAQQLTEQHAKNQNQQLPQNTCRGGGKLRSLPLAESHKHLRHGTQKHHGPDNQKNEGAVLHPKQLFRNVPCGRHDGQGSHCPQDKLKHCHISAHQICVSVLSLGISDSQHPSQPVGNTPAYQRVEKTKNLQRNGHISHSIVSCQTGGHCQRDQCNDLRNRLCLPSFYLRLIHPYTPSLS